MGVYSKKPFGGPKAVLAYLGRHTHRVAISNRRLIAADATGVTFKYKDYRIQGPERYKLMTIATGEFNRRFLMHVLPKGFHRIRHDGLLVDGSRANNVAKARALLNVPKLDMIPAISNLPTHASRRRSWVHAHAAARSSSRFSHGDASQGAGRPPRPPRSGSIGHDRDSITYRDATSSVLAILTADR